MFIPGVGGRRYDVMVDMIFDDCRKDDTPTVSVYICIHGTALSILIPPGNLNCLGLLDRNGQLHRRSPAVLLYRHLFGAKGNPYQGRLGTFTAVARWSRDLTGIMAILGCCWMKEMMKRVDIIMTEWGFLAISLSCRRINRRLPGST
jgi:hypothetical protein